MISQLHAMRIMDAMCWTSFIFLCELNILQTLKSADLQSFHEFHYSLFNSATSWQIRHRHSKSNECGVCVCVLCVIPKICPWGTGSSFTWKHIEKQRHSHIFYTNSPHFRVKYPKLIHQESCYGSQIHKIQEQDPERTHTKKKEVKWTFKKTSVRQLEAVLKLVQITSCTSTLGGGNKVRDQLLIVRSPPDSRKRALGL